MSTTKDNKTEKVTTRKKSTTSKKKTTSKSTVVNKKKNDIKKSEVKKKEVKKNKVLEIITSTKFLWAVFISLIILVMILGILIYKKANSVEVKKHYNIVIPVVNKGNFDFSINASSLSTTREYVFKVTNYRDDKVNKEAISYNIVIDNPNDCKIEVYRDGEGINLMKNNDKTTFDTVTLSNKKKEEIYYRVRMIEHGELDAKGLINISINS